MVIFIFGKNFKNIFSSFYTLLDRVLTVQWDNLKRFRFPTEFYIPVYALFSRHNFYKFMAVGPKLFIYLIYSELLY